MRYISIDIETTGLDIMTNQVLEIGAIIENSKDPKPYEELEKFHCIINHNFIQGSPFAINMNARIFELMAGRVRAKNKEAYDEKHNMVPDEETAVLKFANWVKSKYDTKFRGENPPYNIIVAGKNVSGFDSPFLSTLPGWDRYIKFFRRVLDPGTLYIDWQKDMTPPDLKQCKKKAGIENPEVSHYALEDAWDVIQVLRKKY